MKSWQTYLKYTVGRQKKNHQIVNFCPCDPFREQSQSGNQFTVCRIHVYKNRRKNRTLQFWVMIADANFANMTHSQTC